jgi:uncharacterized protein (DUF362 family)
MMSEVVVIKGERSHGTVQRVLDLIDVKKALDGWDRVLIKVNFITTKTWDTGATTDPLVVETIIQKLKGLPIEVMVVESDANMTSANKAFKVTGMAEMCERNDVSWLNLRHEKDRVKLEVPEHETLRSITVPRLVVESAIISAAKLKTHSETQVTLGMKNLFGLLPDKFKGKYHLRGMHRVITDINTVIKPVLTLVDGFVAMEGMGPVRGNPIKMDVIIAGRDIIATDATASRIMGFNPHQIRHIKLSHSKGLGEIDDIKILGDGIESVKKNFKRAF